MPDTLSIVVNTFNPGANTRVEAMTLTALEHLHAFTASTRQIILADGSGIESPILKTTCTARGWLYAPAPARESFAATYNRGARLATGTHIAWMANDIFVCENWDVPLLRELSRTSAWMVAPYLSVSDYWGQVRHRPIRLSTFAPSFLTFNLNLITRACWETVGPIDERFSGCFNDIDYLMRIRAAGGEVIIADAGDIQHMGMGTRRSGGTDVRWENDRTRFFEKYPDFPRSCEFLGRDPVLCRSALYRFLLRTAWAFPFRPIRNRLRDGVCRCEPLFHRYGGPSGPHLIATASSKAPAALSPALNAAPVTSTSA